MQAKAAARRLPGSASSDACASNSAKTSFPVGSAASNSRRSSTTRRNFPSPRVSSRAGFRRITSTECSTLLCTELPDVSRVSLAVRTAVKPAPPKPQPAQLPGPDVAAEPAPRQAMPFLRAVEAVAQSREDDLSGSPLDRRMTFDAFFVGRSNALAHAAAQQVAGANPGEPVPYNPLFVHAAVGLGKSHLIQATAHLAESRGRRVLYLTAERFMYGFVAALKAQTSIAFKEKLRAIDILVIDDLQFLAGKSIQQEFCHTLNALIDGGKQVLVAADRPPTDLETLDERVRSRLSGGLVVEIGPLDEELRVQDPQISHRGGQDSPRQFRGARHRHRLCRSSGELERA